MLLAIGYYAHWRTGQIKSITFKLNVEHASVGSISIALAFSHSVIIANFTMFGAEPLSTQEQGCFFTVSDVR